MKLNEGQWVKTWPPPSSERAREAKKKKGRGILWHIPKILVFKKKKEDLSDYFVRI